MKLKHLLEELQHVSAFAEPDYTLEQYKTGADLAAHVLFTLHNRFDAFEGRHVADLGTGTGILGIGAALLGALHVVGFDIDPVAISQAAANAEEAGVTDVMSFIKCDVLCGRGLPIRGWAPSSDGPGRPAEVTSAAASAHTGGGRLFDTVIMNPPFGTRRAGADMTFLRAGMALVGPGGCVYSLHKSSTRAHIVRVASSGGLSPDGQPAGIELVAQLKFDIPATYDFHRAESLDVDVDLLRVIRGPSAEARDAISRVESVPPYVPFTAHAVAAPAAASAADGDGDRRHKGGASGRRGKGR